MSSQADGAAYFNARAKEVGVSDEMLTRLSASGITTMAHLAFAVNRPGQDFDEQRFDTWLAQVNGANPSLGMAAAVRRLHFEAEIVLTSTLRATVDHPATESSAPKSIPFAERTARMNQIRNTFPGLNLDGPNEPAQALLDEVAHQYETRTLRYVEPAKANSREAEIAHGRSERKLRIETNTLAVKESKQTPEEDVGTAYKLHQCLRRRAVAYEFGNLISFREHEKYIDRLMRRLDTTPPPGYHTTTLAQVLQADRAVWIYMAQHGGEIRAGPDGRKPLDDLLLEALQDYSVSFHLLPLPASAPNRAAGSNFSNTYAPMRARDDADPSQQFGGKGRNKGKRKNKGKGPASGSSYGPRGIPGAVGRDQRGRPICFDYNLGTCPSAPAGGTCNKGRHICFKANCHKIHTFKEAHANEMPAATPAS